MDDTAFFDQLFAERRQAIYAYLLGRLGHPEGAEDLLQETFLRAWRHIGRLRGLSGEQRWFWLLAVARNLTADGYRRRAVRDERTGVILEDILDPDPSADPARALEARDRLDALDAAIRRLPEDLRTVLAMQIVGEMTSAAIGAALGRPAGTVRYQLSRARRILAREVLARESEPPQDKAPRPEKS